jgi:type 1 capsular polysaccharide biosynthesis protein J
VEGLGALEALRHGVVPVLACGPLTATSQFALSEESVFEAGDPRSLARTIDGWVDRGSEDRLIEAARYRRVGAQYDIRSCVGELERVYRWLVAGGEFPGQEPDSIGGIYSVAR